MMEEKSKNVATSTLKYKVAYSEKLGRYLQAAKDLRAGEVILREDPVAVGPMSCMKDPICFECLSVLPDIEQDFHYICSGCNVVTLCGFSCEERAYYHSTYECEIIKNNMELSIENTDTLAAVLFVLRLWLLKQKDPELWKQVLSLESHLNKRRNTIVWEDREINIVNVLKSLNFVPENDPSVSEIIQQLCGILDVNSFELRSPGGMDGLLLRGLYLEASLMAHDCRGNVHVTADDNFHLTVYASIPIKEGDTIFFNYTSSLLGTTGRREYLRTGKYFECECDLCKDPYEMGSYMSCILCPRCRQGYVGMQDPLTKFPYSKNTKWQCNKCKKIISGCLIKTSLSISKNLVDDVDEYNIKVMENLKEKLSKSLHKNHFLMLSLKQKLLNVYRQEVTGPNPKRKVMRSMTYLCREMYDLLEIVEPGISRLKGIMLYEIHLPLALLANREYNAREISPAELVKRLEEAGGFLKKSLTMLLLEPVDTPEGKLAKRALQELKSLNENIADVKSLIKTETSSSNSKKSQKSKSNKSDNTSDNKSDNKSTNKNKQTENKNV
ncbi:SET domain-containing protein SmydA-8-like isoform X1 [Apis laboriosa]|uniref:SET domain-containing protein SmydA-8-like isoform X1 n=2 Tax=Apis laboriosa TaxID=183418 RepID=UPI001CC5E37F|nr:SET domain-containing protein SmydA-8-like isoform X1 [Apis laboriosa]